MRRKAIYLLVASVGIFGFYYLNSLQYSKVWVAKETIQKGEVLTADKFMEEKTLEVKDWMVESSDSSLFGKTYFKETIHKDEFLSTNDLSKDPLVKYSDNEVTVGIRADNQWDIVGWQIKAGDTIGLSVYDSDTKESILDQKLMGLVVDSIVNSSGAVVSKDDDGKSISTVNVKANPEQAKLIQEYEKKGSIKVVRVGKGMAFKEGEAKKGGTSE
ncbi:hypothetical protein ABNF65_15245 [Paenibacillus larvae]